MKTRLAAALAGLFVILSAFTPQADATPSEADIQSVVSDVAALDYLVKDATPAETAQVVFRVIRSIQGSTASKADKRKAIALVVARAVAYKPGQAPEMVAELASMVKDDLILPVVVSSAIVAAEADSVAVLDALTERFKNDKALLKTINDAANSPVEPLTPPVVKDINNMIREMRKAAVPVIPAQEPTTVPLVPPPIGGRYPGQ